MQLPYYFCIVHFPENDIKVSFINTTSYNKVLVQFNNTFGSFFRKLWPFESSLPSLLLAIGGPLTYLWISLCPYLVKYQSEICISHCVLGGGNVVELGGIPCFLYIMNLHLHFAYLRTSFLRLMKTNVNARVSFFKRNEADERMILQCKASSTSKIELYLFQPYNSGHIITLSK